MTTAEYCSRDGEAGFSLIETLVSVGLMALALVAAFGAVASLTSVPAAGVNRGLAQRSARNILSRARAAAAYFPKPADPTATTLPAGYADPSNLPFAPSSTYDIGVPRAIPQPSGTPLLQNVTFHVTTGFVPAHAGAGTAGTFSVKVEYPMASGAGTGSVALSEDLPNPSFIPGTRVQTTIQEPMRQ
jgi:type II secretory pathway pseudopilin PulG